MHTSTDGSAYRAETGTDGHTIHILQTDYQDYPNGGNGYLRLLRFSPADDKIYASIYSPYLDANLTNAANYEEFAMPYEMEGEAQIELIGTDSAVASGDNASITWPDLDLETNYEWYVTLQDMEHTTTGSIWSFTTQPALSCYLLTLSHTGEGSNPVANPLNSTGCASGLYVAGEAISLSGAVPTSGWQIDSWYGTGNNTSTASTNSLIMPPNTRVAGVNYVEIPPSTGWSAYNDSSWATGQTTTKITTYTYDSNTTGLLKNYATGANTTVTAAITYNGSIAKYPTTGTETTSGTDAYTTFHGIADIVGVINYSSTAGWWIDVTFTGLDPSKTYTFVTSANRAGGSSYMGESLSLLFRTLPLPSPPVPAA